MSYSLHVSIVVYHSDPIWLDKTLRSLSVSINHAADQALLRDCRITLVDNGANSGRQFSDELASRIKTSLQLLTTIGKSTLLSSPTNCGFGTGNNFALRDTTADFVLILNPDVELAADALYSAIAHLHKNPLCALATPIANYPNGEPQFLVKSAPAVLTLAMRGFAPNWLKRRFYKRLSAYDRMDLPYDAALVDCKIVSGCCMLIRGDSWRKAGGFDEKFFLYFEDFDLSMRIAKYAEIHRVPQFRIVHAGGNAAAKGASHIGLFARSAYRFFHKHGWRW